MGGEATQEDGSRGLGVLACSLGSLEATVPFASSVTQGFHSPLHLTLLVQLFFASLQVTPLSLAGLFSAKTFNPFVTHPEDLIPGLAMGR